MTGEPNNERRDPLADLVVKVSKNQEFTDEEVALLKRVADFSRGLESFGRLALGLRKVLMFLGWLVAAWVVFKVGFAEMVRDIKP